MRAKPRLSSDDLDAIIGIIEGWRAKLTWEALVDRITAVFGRTYTRQALERHDHLKRAFQVRKRRLREAVDTSKVRAAKASADEVSPELVLERKRRHALEEKVARLETTVRAYDEQFATWLYNARLAGLTKERLNSKLPTLERGRSDGRKDVSPSRARQR